MPGQVGHHQPSNAHAEQLLHEIARRAGVAEPTLRLTRSKGPSVVPPDKKNKRWSVELPSRDVSQPDQVLRGWFAHEIQHISHADCVDGTHVTVSRRDMVLAYLSLAGIYAVAGLGLTMGMVHHLQTGALVAAGLIWLAVVPFLVLRRIYRLGRRRVDGTSQQLIELRNDLAAVKLTGPEDVTAALAELARRDSRPYTRSALRVNRWLMGGASSHPPFELRIAAVNGYDLNEDPLGAATKWLPR